MNKTLIAYVTKGGATEEAAHTIRDVLRAKFRLNVDMVNLRKEPLPNLEFYRNVVIGAGVRTGKVYREALQLLEANLEGKNVAFFICFAYLSSLKTSLPNKDSKSMNPEQVVDNYIKAVLSQYPKVHPILVGAADGCLRVFGKAVSGDIDSAKTTAWATELGRRLTSVKSKQ